MLPTAALILFAPGALFAADHFVSPDGSPGGTGAIDRPWDLATALAHPRAVRPGDTVWLREGVYTGAHLCRLAGTAQAPIVLRAYRNERVVFDRRGLDSQNRGSLTLVGAHVWVWGFEFTNSEPERVFRNSFTECAERQHCRPGAISVMGAGVKVINNVIHNTGDGIAMWAPAVNAEAYGNIVFFGGWQTEIRGGGHAIYAQNRDGTKRIVDNVLFSGFHSGIHFFGSRDSGLRNLVVEGNTIFNNGLLAEDPNGWGILIGGSTIAENVTIRRNFLYNPDWFRRSNNLGPAYGEGSVGVVLEDNYSAGFRALGSDQAVTALRASGNVLLGQVDAVVANQLRVAPRNSISSFAAAGQSENQIFLRRNQYEPNKTIVTIFNWRRQQEVPVDLSSVLKLGDQYEIIDLQNYFGGSIRSGEFDGKPISIPMNSGSAKPIGNVPGTRYRTGVEFGVFQVRVRSESAPGAVRMRTTPAALSFSRTTAGGTPAPQEILIESATGRAEWIAESNEAWLRLDHRSGSAPSRLRVRVAADSPLPAGSSEAAIIIRCGDETRIVPVTVRIVDDPDRAVIDAITNSATRRTTLAEHSLLSVEGTQLAEVAADADPHRDLPTELGGTRVLVDGSPAYLRAVRPNQLLLIAPQAHSAKEVSEVVVRTPRGETFLTVDRASASPALFEIPESIGEIAASHPDGVMVGAEGTGKRPARAGDHIALYLTGLTGSHHAPGAAVAHPPASLPERVEVEVAGIPAQVTFAGILYPGFGQVNVVVPDVPAGYQSIVVRQGGSTSQPGAYLLAGQ